MTKKTTKTPAKAKRAPVPNRRVNVSKPGDRTDLPDEVGGTTLSGEVTGATAGPVSDVLVPPAIDPVTSPGA